MAQKVITFHYTLTGDEGKVLDSTVNENPLIFLTGVGQLLPALEDAVKDMEKGGKKSFSISHEQAYGAYNKELVFNAHIKEMPHPDVEVGQVFEVGVDGQNLPVMVTKVDGEQITLDGNPPKQTEELNFSIEVVDTRDATPEEIDHGHVHDQGCTGH